MAAENTTMAENVLKVAAKGAIDRETEEVKAFRRKVGEKLSKAAEELLETLTPTEIPLQGWEESKLFLYEKEKLENFLDIYIQEKHGFVVTGDGRDVAIFHIEQGRNLKWYLKFSYEAVKALENLRRFPLKKEEFGFSF